MMEATSMASTRHNGLLQYKQNFKNKIACPWKKTHKGSQIYNRFKKHPKRMMLTCIER